MECIVCDKEIMAGKRCIECFISKKTKKPEVVILPTKPATVMPDGIQAVGQDNTIPIHEGPVDLWPNIDYSVADTHTMTSTSATADDGTIIRKWKVTYPRFDLSVDYP